MKSRAGDWLKQARSEMDWARDSFTHGHWAFVCFTSQQVAEKCLKSIALHRGAAQVKGHSTFLIAQALKINGQIEMMAQRLDQYYITTRYPDAFSEGAPYEFFTEEQAKEALGFAEAFIAFAAKELEKDAR
jgi:HEPN domain-containing protein